MRGVLRDVDLGSGWRVTEGRSKEEEGRNVAQREIEGGGEEETHVVQ